MDKKRRAFTLLEVLIALVLLGMIIPALFKSISLLTASNKQLEKHLRQMQTDTHIYETLYEDIAGSDGNITLRSGDFDALCLHKSVHSLYALNDPTVCWVVLRGEKRLVRVEGYRLRFPFINERLRQESPVYVDSLFETEIFKVQRKNDRLLVVIKKRGSAPVAFVVSGIPDMKKIKKKRPKRKRAKKTAKKSNR
jgi:prepilin-type N-terminal cleavage/methylation domain-containing protein